MPRDIIEIDGRPAHQKKSPETPEVSVAVTRGIRAQVDAAVNGDLYTKVAQFWAPFMQRIFVSLRGNLSGFGGDTFGELREFRDGYLYGEAPYVQTVERALLNFVARESPSLLKHLMNVRKFGTEVIHNLPGKVETINYILTGLALHDIGKLVTGNGILLHRGVFEPEQMAKMTTHTERGYYLLLALGMPDAVVDMALRHHQVGWENRERFAKSYPKDVEGEPLPPHVRLGRGIDTTVAMFENRPDRPSAPPEKIIAKMEELRPIHGDDVTDVIVHLVSSYPLTKWIDPHL